MLLTIVSTFAENEISYEIIENGKLRVIAYSGISSELTVPEVVNGMTVIEIGMEAFMDNKQLVSIDLPDSITIIRSRAFKGCTKLSNMY